MNSDKGTIESFRVTQPDHELLIPNHGNLPLFKIEFRSEDLKYMSFSSSQAKKVSVVKTVENGSEIIVINYEGIGNLGLGARVTVR
ncbi:MAG TPA: hypothetical protein VK541_11495, partial [Pedobacter sp.]|uniref:hypothetical protein n=1 Tax=Pedobacter sp. TaxID=1411316 RepID=UPI002CF114E5